MSNAASQEEAPDAKLPKRGRKRPWLFIAPLFLVLAAWLTAGYLHYDDQFASTEDAYVGADQVQVGPQVSGLIIKAPQHNNQPVHKGDLLFQIDPTPFQAQLDAAHAALKSAQRAQATAEAAVATAKATLTQREAEAQSANDHLHRLAHLSNQRFVSAQDLEDAQSQAKVASAAVAQAKAALHQVQVDAGSPGDTNDRIQAARARIASAEYALSRTQVRAPMSGILANYGIERGQTVAANQSLFSIVATKGVWVDANLKETEVGRVRIGDTARISSDLYPNRVFHGHVIAIAGGSGTAFSLLPPQNATGNWVKVTQRVPVRIQLDDTNPQQRLPIGTSTDIRINLTSHPQGFWASLLDVIHLNPHKPATAQHAAAS